MLEKLQSLAADCAAMQHEAAVHSDDNDLRVHISNTLQRCLPAAIVTETMTDACFHAIHSKSSLHDPMYTGAIHAWAAHYLLTNASASADPLLKKLQLSARLLLPQGRDACRDDLRLVALDALYTPHCFPPGTHTAFINYRLGLRGPRLTCEEIAVQMNKPLVYIHELESAILTFLSCNGGLHA